MRKVLTLLIGVILLFPFSFTSNQVSASGVPSSMDGTNVSETKQVQEKKLASSRYVQHLVYYKGNVTPPSTYHYSDNRGFSGRIPLQRYEYLRNIDTTMAVYAGTVYCSGVCPIQ